MGFVSVLKKVGTVLANIASIEAIGVPLIKQALPAADQPVVDRLDLIFKTVYGIEGAFAAAFPGQQTGPAKAIAVSTLIAPLLASVDSIAGTHTQDSPAKQAAILKITGGFADYLNALGGGNENQLASGAITVIPSSVTLAAIKPPTSPGSGVPVAVGPEPAKGGA